MLQLLEHIALAFPGVWNAMQAIGGGGGGGLPGCGSNFAASRVTTKAAPAPTHKQPTKNASVLMIVRRVAALLPAMRSSSDGSSTVVPKPSLPASPLQALS